MIHRIVRPIVLTFTCLALASCRDATTEPENPVGRPPTVSEVVVASNTWITRADMPTERVGLATAVVTNAAGQSILYAIGGGASNGVSLSKVEAYNVATNTWTTKAPLPMPLKWTNGAGVIGGKLYISGGLAAGLIRRELYVYDPAVNTWTRKRDMPNTSFRGVTGVINGKLYVLTSCFEEECLLFEEVAFYRYNPATDRWARLPTPTSPHDHGMGAVIGGKFYVTGGSNGVTMGTDGIRQLDVYDPVTNLWTTKAPMPRGRWVGAGTTLGGKLHVIGGFQRNLDGSVSAVRTNSAYNPATNTWTTKAPLPTARHQIAASRVVLNGLSRIEVVGGSRPGNNLAYIP